MVGAPTIRMFTAIFATSHHGQWGQDEYSRSAAREGDFCPNSLKIEGARWMVRYLASCTIKENQSGISKPTTRIIHGVLGASAFSPSELCNAPLTVNGDRARTSTTSNQLTWHGSKDGGPSHP
jgi:hypothetical protein